MHQLTRYSLIGCLTLMGSGCSMLGLTDDEVSPDDLEDYTTAKMAAPLKVPADIGTDNSQDLYVVPELMPESRGQVLGNENEALPPLQVLTLGNDVRQNKEVRNSSAFINAPEIKVWDVVNQFIEGDQIVLTTKALSDGVIETDWVTQYKKVFWGSDEAVSRHRFRVSILDAERPNETRLDVEVIAAEKFTEDEGWEPYVDVNRVGSEFMNQILGYLYVENIEESRQRVSQSALGGITVNLGSDPDGNPALVTSAGFEQTWNRLPVAMKMVKMQIDDKDRGQRMYFISQDKSEGGFFESLAFWSDNEELDLEKGSYRVQISQEGEQTYIVFTDTDDVPLKADVLSRNFPLLARAFKARVKDLDGSTE